MKSSDCCGGRPMNDQGICPRCKENCEWVDDDEDVVDATDSLRREGREHATMLAIHLDAMMSAKATIPVMVKDANYVITVERVDVEKDYHASDCATHNMPALPNGPCDCGLAQGRVYAQSIKDRLLEAQRLCNESADAFECDLPSWIGHIHEEVHAALSLLECTGAAHAE